MGLAVVTVASGGLPVVEATFGTPVTEATNLRGVPVTKVVGKPGLPVRFETIGIGGGGITPTTATIVDGNAIITGGTIITISSIGGGARSASVRSTGKYYFEVVHTTIATTSTGSGLTATGVSSNLFIAPGVDTFVVYKSGNIYTDGANSGVSVGAFTNGQLLGFAIDWDNDKAWVRLGAAGNWNGAAIGSQNPATNVGGVTIAGLLDGRPAWWGNGPSEAAVFNFGATAFSGAVPAGFTAGWPA